MESHIRIKATVQEMYTFFEEESGARFMEIRDTRYSSDEIDRMPAAERDKTVFNWFVILRHPEAKRELHGIFTISEIKKKLEEMKAKQDGRSPPRHPDTRSPRCGSLIWTHMRSRSRFVPHP